MAAGGLRARWAEVCQVLGVEAQDPNATERWWQVLHARYGEKGRVYHTLEHLTEMFEHFDEHRARLRDPTAVVLAIFFHDVIYDPRAGSPKNEADSALLFERFGQEAVPAGDPPGRARGELVLKVSEWILRTASHRCKPGDELDCRLFMDFDMAVLGKPWPEYEEYSRKIRREYAHVPEAAYCTGRGAFLEATAKGPPVFSSEAFGGHEAQARENMTREAAMLGDRLSKCTAPARLVSSLAVRFKAASKVLRYLMMLKKPKAMLALFVALALAVRLRQLALRAVAALVAMLLCYLLRLVLFSAYFRYPYREPAARRGVAVLAGSFNPPHVGHLEMIKHLSKRHAHVHVVIGVNPAKAYEVSAYERQELLRAMIRELDIRDVEVVVHSSIIVDYARSQGAKVMYRGIRTWQQDGRAEKYLELQNVLYQLSCGCLRPIPTAYLQANPQLSGVSSTLLRRRIAEGAEVSDLVPPGCAAAVARAYAGSG